MARRRHDLGNDHLLDLCAARFDLFRLDASASEQICDLFRIFWKIDKFAQPVNGKFHKLFAVIPNEVRDLAKTCPLSKNTASDLRDGLRICGVPRPLRGSGRHASWVP